MTSALSGVPAISTPSPTSVAIPGQAPRGGSLRGADTPATRGKRQPLSLPQKSRVPDSGKGQSLSCHSPEQLQEGRLTCTA